MRIATWNVNSIRAREERLLRWLEAHSPDVLCLQELKVQDEAFPLEAIRKAGYHAAIHGQKTYNGVAILAREEPTAVECGLGDDVADAQARLVLARVGGIHVLSVYVPNGGEVGSDKWAYKLAWLARLRAWLDRRFTPTDDVVVCGDFNVAPEARDVERPEVWEPSVLFHPEARKALAAVADFGLVDCFRRHEERPGFYTWWDYRMLAFPKNDGLRIDHVLATRALAARSTAVTIDREERKGKGASDHVPVTATFS